MKQENYKKYILKIHIREKIKNTIQMQHLINNSLCTFR